MSTPISTPSSGGPSTPLNRLHVHSSIASHLSTELSLLQTLLLRARDQHRTQLFLRRMHEVLRIGKILLKYVRETSSVHTDESGWETRRSTGERLIYRMVKSLFTAQRFTSQIIELHHFLPLQASVLAIYSRLFTISMNIASGLGMDIDQVIQHGGQLNCQKKKKLRIVNVDDERDRIGEVILSDTTKGLGEDMGIHGIELGEKIERSSMTPQGIGSSAPASRFQSPLPISSSKRSSASSTQVPCRAAPTIQSPSRILPARYELGEDDANISSQDPETPKSGRISNDYESAKDGRADGILKKKKRRSHDMDFIFDSVSSPAQSPNMNDGGSLKDPNEPKKKKKIASTAVEAKLDKPKKKKKKQDAMDDIFGF
ncbi:uncharacterized protein L199_000490 [Kwoniella botswanensis]|uniref:uncharacterized protein n=1 Tax=Kwoniella botswanensis TaxID=1268659 RepID=UPI00315D74AC